ncbi:MAG TPA: hypothetical protein VFK05_39545 [Polyangiaceae bacterium]|nr:hypothetical protein [Polyangiaceae bacterium]
MTQAMSGAGSSSAAGELAALLIERESAQADSAKQDREAARRAFLGEAQQQVDALNEAAAATLTGAALGASLTVAGGAFQIGAATFQYDVDMGKAHGAPATAIATNELEASIRGDVGDTFAKLAEPGKALVGDSTAARYQAEAKHHETLAEQAKWQADDASATLDKADKRGDKVLDLLQGIQQEDQSSAQAIIGRI